MPHQIFSFIPPRHPCPVVLTHPHSRCSWSIALQDYSTAGSGVKLPCLKIILSLVPVVPFGLHFSGRANPPHSATNNPHKICFVFLNTHLGFSLTSEPFGSHTGHTFKLSPAAMRARNSFILKLRFSHNPMTPGAEVLKKTPNTTRPVIKWQE